MPLSLSIDIDIKILISALLDNEGHKVDIDKRTQYDYVEIEGRKTLLHDAMNHEAAINIDIDKIRESQIEQIDETEKDKMELVLVKEDD